VFCSDCYDLAWNFYVRSLIWPANLLQLASARVCPCPNNLSSSIMPNSDLRLLALDGGGVRGLSSPMILQQLMATVNSNDPQSIANILT
jgi:hypothetical protein